MTRQGYYMSQSSPQYQGIPSSGRWHQTETHKVHGSIPTRGFFKTLFCSSLTLLIDLPFSHLLPVKPSEQTHLTESVSKVPLFLQIIPEQE